MSEVAIGIDIGGTCTCIGVVDKKGNIIAETSIPTQESRDFNVFIENLSTAISDLITPLKNLDLRGIGIGAPNGNYYKGTVEYPPNLPWKGVSSIVDKLKIYFDVPMVLTNDANAAAIGEMIYGGAKGIKNFVVITLGTGLGSGFVVNGSLMYGDDGFAGEAGHMTAIENGRKCGCGKKGCLETYASATGIVNTVKELLSNSKTKSSLRKIPENEISSKLIYEAAKDGDKIALEAFEYTGKILGISLANIVNITSPKMIIIFGGLAKSGNLIIKPTKKAMEANVLPVFRDKVNIKLSELSEENAAVLGASALVWKEF
jgi:glucokinase